MGAEFFVSVVMTAFAHQIQIKLAEHDGKGVGVEDFEGIAGVGSPLNLVTAWGGRSGFLGGPSRLEEAFGAEFHGVANLRGGERTPFDSLRRQRNTSTGRPWQEKAHPPVGRKGMGGEEGKRC